MADDELPDIKPQPESVRTVTDLAEQLQRHRTWKGKPSFRTMAARSRSNSDQTRGRLRVLPQQTACDATSGIHLPSLEVVEAFVVACEVGIPDLSEQGPVEPWRLAWRQAATNPNGKAQTVKSKRSKPESTAAGKPERGAGEARQALDRLSTLPVSQSAKLLREMDERDAADLLAGMDTRMAVRRLGVVGAEKAAALLGLMDESLAAERLSRLGPARTEVIRHMPLPVAASVIAEMPSEEATAVLFGLPQAHELIEASEPTVGARILAGANPNLAADWLGAMDPGIAAEILAVPDMLLGSDSLLASLANTPLAAILSRIRTSLAVEILARITPERVRALLMGLDVDQAESVLSAMPVSVLFQILDDASDADMAYVINKLPAYAYPTAAVIGRFIGRWPGLEPYLSVSQITPLIAVMPPVEAARLVGSMSLQYAHETIGQLDTTSIFAIMSWSSQERRVELMSAMGVGRLAAVLSSGPANDALSLLSEIPTALRGVVLQFMPGELQAEWARSWAASEQQEAARAADPPALAQVSRPPAIVHPASRPPARRQPETSPPVENIAAELKTLAGFAEKVSAAPPEVRLALRTPTRALAIALARALGIALSQGTGGTSGVSMLDDLHSDLVSRWEGTGEAAALIHDLQHIHERVSALVRLVLASSVDVKAIDIRFDQIDAVVATVDDFRNADLRDVDMTGFELDGIRFSTGTLWPAEWKEEVHQSSVQVSEEDFVIHWSRIDGRDELPPDSISGVTVVSEWLRELILDTGGVVERQSRYKDDLAYWVDGREIAHLEAENVLDLRLTKAVIARNRAELKADPRIELRGNSDWVTVSLTGAEDAAFVRWLVEQAKEANRKLHEG